MVALDKTASVINAAGTIVIKIGSSILVDDDSHSVNAAWLAGIAAVSYTHLTLPTILLV